MRPLLALLLVGCASSTQPYALCQEGDISYYAASLDGNRTASGERYRHGELTAAHRTWPLGSDADVMVGDRRVRVRINDRGPYAKQRILDVSGAAARQLNLGQKGHAHARVCRVSPR